MHSQSERYAARVDVDYPEKLNRLSTLVRFVLAIPILIILSLLTATGNETVLSATGDVITRSTGGVLTGLWLATALMIIFRRRYPRWWFDFAQELIRFLTRILAYLTFLTDRYPSTEDTQSVHLDLDYPDAESDLHQWMPVVKWFLAIPHYVVLAVLWSIAVIVVIFSWLVVVFSGRYPRPLFNFVVGVGRWTLRVYAYAFLLLTDDYPPFSLT